MPLDRRITVRVATTTRNHFGEPVSTATDYPVWATLIQDRIARNIETGGTYGLADRVWRVRFNQAFPDALTAGHRVSVIYDDGADPDIVTGIGEPDDRVNRRRFLDLLS